MENKTKRFYKVGEMVWVVGQKKEGKVKSINKESKTVTVTIKDGIQLVEHTVNLWEIDKLKYKAKEQLVKKVARKQKSSLPTVFFAKVKPEGIIPSKRDEDAGYDIYACVEPQEVEGKLVHEIICPAFKTTLVPTGIAMALPKTHYFNTKHERGSTGKISMSVLSGVIDSGYRGELFIAITPLHKDVLISSEVTETEVNEDFIIYPYSKAIAQGTIELVPQVNIEEITFEELQSIESERGATKLGQSGK
jgi:dUTP pyrophosphatase